jgi:hypothetical protein
MAKSKPRDYFRYPQGEEDLVKFVVKVEKPPSEPQFLFTEEELKSTLKTVDFDKIKENIRTKKVLNFNQEALLLTNRDHQCKFMGLFQFFQLLLVVSVFHQ